MIEDGVITATSDEQTNLEERITDLYREFVDNPLSEGQENLVLHREQHVSYLHGGLQYLPSGFIVLDSSRPWICYWIVHSLALLDAPLPTEVSSRAVADFLALCQDPEGGFGGGPMQLPHLAPTYAAVACLVSLGGEAALSVVHKQATLRFLQQRAVAPEEGGGFTVCEGGEVDVRGCYTAMAAAHMLSLDKHALAAKASMVQYVKRCQTYEGGLGGEPGNEAHGGYTFCGLAALMLVDQAHQLDLPRLVHWAVHMQGAVEGGFMGRTNKLVDGCYSFWQGGVFPLLQKLMPDYLAQCGIPHTPASSSSTTVTAPASAAVAADAGSGCRDSSRGGQAPTSSSCVPAADDTSCGEGPVSGGDGGLAVAEADVMRLEGKDPVMQALDDLHRTKGKAEAAAAAAAAAEAASRQATQADADNAPELYRKAQQMLAASRSLQQAVQRAADNTDMIEATAALLCTQHQPSDTVSQTAVLEQQEGDSGEAGSEVQTASQQEGNCPMLYNVEALQLWLLKCCQAPRGGMRDKPGKPPDYYHTCYCLSGLSSSQNYGRCVLGASSNKLVKADPLCNVVEHRLVAALDHAKS